MANPQTQTATATKQPVETHQWVSFDEATKLNRYLKKQFVPKGDEKFAKKFYYRVEAIIPYTPAGSFGPESHLYQFMIQKYHRNKTETVSVMNDNGSSEEVERNARVEGHEMRDGKWICVDPTANRLIDSGTFKDEFVADTFED